MTDLSSAEHKTVEFTSIDGVRLFSQYWLPEKPEQAVVLIVHGLNEHSDRYTRFTGHLLKRHFAVETFDLRGHGRSESPVKPTYINQFEEHQEDLDLFQAVVKDRHPDVPVFLFGHSMGGTIAAKLLIERRITFAGLILSSPGLQIGEDTPGWLIKLSGLLSGLAPRLTNRQISPERLTRDQEVVQRIKADPMYYSDGIPARTGAELLKAMDSIQSGACKISLPLLVMHGGADTVTSPAGSESCYHKAASDDKTLKIYDNAYHEILNEPEKDQVMQDISGWINERI
jgi:acylglycerol lipase